ncbi:MAG TPA: hypothetical protein DDW94_13005 [Deltaproteobacteria bacterium]|nr:MAG: hypothetical protein A2Z79_06770 [Deltaproteobacteria bacterium GWA2_55_82]OIJ73123.1 MAG: hypothetical protein A2V21_301895 [Deltaproteobacteria bacterium GWC2_55_46]HBG47890.1 hypothetical protein [Deltaproteobacteria bacterium]HCY11847.1 hypothetical protein [Deltaproteobacteria bacterium]
MRYHFTKKTGVGRGLAVLCVLLLSAALFQGCGVGKESGKPAGEAGYNQALNRWSRGFKVYEGLESRLYMNATYKSVEFRKAYIQRYSESYAMGPERSQMLLERELEQAEGYNEFFFAAYTPDESINDFDKAASVWQLYLEDGSGGKVRPISIARVENSDAVIREFFPYYDLWSKAYVVKFPKYNETGQEIPGPDGLVRLTVTGVMGKGALEWRSGGK